jgi:hypothetical protein
MLIGFAGFLADAVTGGLSARSEGEGLQGFLRALLYVATIHYNLGSTMVWVGAILYGIGRIFESGFVTLVGFERTPPSKLIVRGPDENNVVWIGNPYHNIVDAEAAARAFSDRLGSAAQ